MPGPPSRRIAWACGQRAAATLLAFVVASNVLGCARASHAVPPPPVPLRPLTECSATVRLVPRDSIKPFGDGRQPPEDVELRVSRSVPGGLTSFDVYLPSERSVLQMVDTTRADTVRRALLAAYVADTAMVTPLLLERVRRAELRQVAFSYANLVDWWAYLSRLLFEGAPRENVSISAIGVNLHTVHVQVMVATEADRARLEAWLAHADIPCGLIETELGRVSAGRDTRITVVKRR